MEAQTGKGRNLLKFTQYLELNLDPSRTISPEEAGHQDRITMVMSAATRNFPEPLSQVSSSLNMKPRDQPVSKGC